MSSFKINKRFFDILSMPNIDHFSTVEIRTAYIALNRDPSLDSSAIRRNIYTEILRFVKRGWLKKLISEKKGITRFVKTDLFNAEFLDIQSKSIVVDKNEVAKTTKVIALTDNLLSRLNNYKSSLLEGLGEAEEYKNLRTEYPNMHESLLEKYNAVRERNTRLLGKIKAIESLIKAQK